MTYTATVTFTVDEDTDEHLQDPQSVRHELQSWLESLKAEVLGVTVQEGEKS